MPEGRARLNALRSGQANIALIDARQIPEAKGAGLAIQIVEKNAYWVIYPNLAKGPLGDIRIRRAIMYAIDRQGLAEALTNGSARATEQLWSSKSPFYVKELDDRYPFDPDKAKALMAEAGFKDGFELQQLLLNNSEYRQLAEALQANLAEVGIRLKFDVVDVSQFPLFFKQPPRGDILMARYGGRSDPIQTVYELVGTGGSYAPGGSASPRIDGLLTHARRLAASDPKRVDGDARSGAGDFRDGSDDPDHHACQSVRFKARMHHEPGTIPAVGRRQVQRCADRTRLPMMRGMRNLLVAAAMAFAPGVALAEGNPNATIIYYDAVGNETLDPAEPQSGSSFSQEVLLALYDTLVRLDDAGNPQPGLAESWKASPDLTSFTLVLRRGVKFHDGTELTAEVVKQNLQRSLALGTKASGTMIESVKMIELSKSLDRMRSS